MVCKTVRARFATDATQKECHRFPVESVVSTLQVVTITEAVAAPSVMVVVQSINLAGNTYESTGTFLWLRKAL